ncbi:MAG TPA: bacterioferritin-associated ferredoxin [Spongiibacteraceae bacterium]|jgi:bacterioferritin-associated ferredoxin|nr:bacterioferritin-associated ferredoxin [Spongiibacteraceae bacterium]HUH38653.1 bacterioferritin-associated ferredoxin [Spongiibacteraceae bacterium]
MYICLCKGITDHQIHSAVAAGTTSFRELRRELDIASQCGKCGSLAREVFNEALPPLGERIADALGKSVDDLFYPA